MRSPAHPFFKPLAVLLAFLLAVALSACELEPYRGEPASPKLAVIGDSLIFHVQDIAPAHLAVRGWNPSVTGFGGYATSDQFPWIDEYLKSSPQAIVIALGTNDIRKINAGVESWDQFRADVKTALTKVKDVPCVAWIGVGEYNGSYGPGFGELVNSGPLVNAMLREELAAANRAPNTTFFGDWAALSTGHDEYFIGPGDVHHSEEGERVYADLVANTAAKCPNAPTKSPAQPAAPALFTPVTPTRILDSRNNTGGYSTPWGATTTRPVAVTGTFKSVTIPHNATAITANVTVTRTSSSGFLTVWPSAQVRPNASSVNWYAGDTRAAHVTVPVGPDGRVSIFTSSPADVILDIVGFHSPDPSVTASTYSALNSPTRIVDSRNGTGGFSTPFAAGSPRNVSIAGATSVPANASAVVLNATVTNTKAAGYLTVYPSGEPLPVASNLNWPRGDTRANLVTVPIGSSGSVTAVTSTSADVIFDVVGYYVKGASGDAFSAIRPTRMVDTRFSSQIGSSWQAFGPSECRVFKVTGMVGNPIERASIPEDATSVLLTVTVVPSPYAPGGHATVYPTGQARPLASNLNWPNSDVRSNQVLARVGSNGSVTVCTRAGYTHMIVDVVGYSTATPATLAE